MEPLLLMYAKAKEGQVPEGHADISFMLLYQLPLSNSLPSVNLALMPQQ